MLEALAKSKMDMKEDIQALAKIQKKENRDALIAHNINLPT